ncbi:MAG: 2-dehydropantoate 2-reductase [Acetobacteraceae bacterium]|nr:2-dehydropantoate 2-reductase [Acetobacteraceae bacterium]
MRIAILGTGGIGGPLGASLAAAGHDVAFLARGAHLAAMRADGLRITGDRGETLIRPARATDDPAAIGPVDLVLVCVKLWDVEAAGAACRPLIGSETAVIPLQNGVDAAERLVPILGAAHVLGGLAMVTGSIVAPGVIRQTGTHHRVAFGRLDGAATLRERRIEAAARAAGIDAVLAPDIGRARWEKFILLTAIAGLCALARVPLGAVRADPDLAALHEAAMREALAVGLAEGVALDEAALEPGRAFLRDQPDGLTPSMLVDLRAGRRLELPWLNGRVVALGAAHGIAVPVNGTIHAALKPHAMGRESPPPLAGEG